MARTAPVGGMSRNDADLIACGKPLSNIGIRIDQPDAFVGDRVDTAEPVHGGIRPTEGDGRGMLVCEALGCVQRCHRNGVSDQAAVRREREQNPVGADDDDAAAAPCLDRPDVYKSTERLVCAGNRSVDGGGERAQIRPLAATRQRSIGEGSPDELVGLHGSMMRRSVVMRNQHP